MLWAVELLRSGRQGESAELLPPAELEAIDRAMRRQLEELGSDFPYDELVAGAELCCPAPPIG